MEAYLYCLVCPVYRIVMEKIVGGNIEKDSDTINTVFRLWINNKNTKE